MLLCAPLKLLLQLTAHYGRTYPPIAANGLPYLSVLINANTRKRAVRILGRSPITYPGKAPDALEREKRVFHLGLHPAFGGVCFFVPLAGRRYYGKRVCW